ncbi:protein FAM135A-like isoform X2 [Artemia franciscana]|uniref:DUF676 domain-containing protein n=1 Tax=Artemia franciscana TaxID=6661 RepID=A0AA88I9S9_ARTSF|nr:hypothetical protein QYM36_000918 [Artemia franciscana]
MGDLQASVEFFVELGKFYNVDLFQRGIYQIRSTIRTSAKTLSRCEVTLKNRPITTQVTNKRANAINSILYPAVVTSGYLISKTFQILYKSEDVYLNDLAVFKLNILVDSSKVEESIAKAEFTLVLELWFTDQGYDIHDSQAIICVSQRALQIHFSPSKGLYYHLPVLFDCFHLGAVTVSGFGAITTIHQPSINAPKSSKTWNGSKTLPALKFVDATMESVLFGSINSIKCNSSMSSFSLRFAHARQIHRNVCLLLLSAADTLRSQMRLLSSLLLAKQRPAIPPCDAPQVRLQKMVDEAEILDSEEDFILLANSHVTRLCAENIVLWRLFQESFATNESVQLYFAKQHHQQRVKRFSEGFYVIDNPRKSASGCYDANSQSYQYITDMLRKSRYLALLPSLLVHCSETNGDSTTLPIIFEDRYQETVEFARRRSLVAKSTDGLSSSCVDIWLSGLTTDNEPSEKYFGKPQKRPMLKPLVLASNGNQNVLKSPSLDSQPIYDTASSDIRTRSSSNSEMKNEVEIRPKIETRGNMSKCAVQSEEIVNETRRSTGLESDSMVSTQGIKSENIYMSLSECLTDTRRLTQVDNHKSDKPSMMRQGSKLWMLKEKSLSRSSVFNSTPMLKNYCAIRSSKYFEPVSKPPPRKDKVMSLKDVRSLSSISFKNRSYRLSDREKLCQKPFFRRRRSNPFPKTNLSVVLVSYRKLEPNQEKRKLSASESLPELKSIMDYKPSSHSFSDPGLDTVLSYSSPLSGGLAASTSGLGSMADSESSSRKMRKRHSSDESSSNSAFTAASKSTSERHRRVWKSNLLKLDVATKNSSSDVSSECSGWVSNCSRASSTDLSSQVTSPIETNTFVTVHESSQYISNQSLNQTNSGDHQAEKVKTSVVSKCVGNICVETNKEEKTEHPLAPPVQFRDPPLNRSRTFHHTLTIQTMSMCSPDMPSQVKNNYPGSLHRHQRSKSSPGVTLEKKQNNLEKEREMLANNERNAIPLQSEIELVPLRVDGLKITNIQRAIAPIFNQSASSAEKKREEMNMLALERILNDLAKSKKRDGRDSVFSLRGQQSLTQSASSFSNGSPLSFQECKSLPGTFNHTALARKKSKSQGEVFAVTGRELSCDCYNSVDGEKRLKEKLASVIGDDMLNFIKAKEDFKRIANISGILYSDLPGHSNFGLPYFSVADDQRPLSPDGLHLVVCVHGLDGNSSDLRLVRTYLELALPGSNLEFLMSERNQGGTFASFEMMTDRLVSEILYHIEAYSLNPKRISFIGHSLGAVLIRSAITRSQMKHLWPRFHTYLSLSGPHLGTLYNSSGLVNAGMWLIQRLKKSGSLYQLSMKDSEDIRQTFLFKLARNSQLHLFKNVVLCGSAQDRYVPLHSARIELCKAAVRDVSIVGLAYQDMVRSIIQPIIDRPEVNLVRYDIHHSLPNGTNTIIGRAAHIAVLDSELFLEKFFLVAGAKYFQ